MHYGYDAEGRLLKHYEARQGHSTAAFHYDAADNLTADDTGPAVFPVTDNRLGQWQNLFMQYDWWGNLVRRRSGFSEQHYTYDAENRLIKAEGSGPQGRFSAHYHYDALGRRIRKTVTTQQGTLSTRFLWQGCRLLQEQQENGRCHTWLYDPDETWSPLARIEHRHADTEGDIFWFSTDLNGAPLEMTDENGDLRWSGQYGSFGEVRRQSEGFSRRTVRPALHHQPLRYAGQYADSETGLHYNLFRYYDPQVGRFTVQDPIGLAGGLNLYAYAPNPLGWIDPLGLTKVTVGRWMGPSEYDQMINSGKVVQSSTGTTHVALPANIEAFGRQAKTGTIYVEFNVPEKSLIKTNEGWAKIVGPDSLEGRLAKRKGNPLPEMPAAENIQVKAHKTEDGVKKCSQKY